MSNAEFKVNPNTVLLAIIMGLSVWTLKTVSEVQQTQARMTVQIQNLERVVYTTSSRE